jgi:DNA polymerase theta
VNTAIEEGTIDQLGIVVLEELHMLKENRGYLIELLITKLLCRQQGIQLIGVSATLSNPQLIAGWLNAKFYILNYRPIPVEEHLVYENAIYTTVKHGAALLDCK